MSQHTAISKKSSVHSGSHSVAGSSRSQSTGYISYAPILAEEEDEDEDEDEERLISNFNRVKELLKQCPLNNENFVKGVELIRQIFGNRKSKECSKMTRVFATGLASKYPMIPKLRKRNGALFLSMERR